MRHFECWNWIILSKQTNQFVRRLFNEIISLVRMQTIDLRHWNYYESLYPLNHRHSLNQINICLYNKFYWHLSSSSSSSSSFSSFFLFFINKNQILGVELTKKKKKKKEECCCEISLVFICSREKKRNDHSSVVCTNVFLWRLGDNRMSRNTKKFKRTSTKTNEKISSTQKYSFHWPKIISILVVLFLIFKENFEMKMRNVVVIYLVNW